MTSDPFDLREIFLVGQRSMVQAQPNLRNEPVEAIGLRLPQIWQIVGEIDVKYC